MVASAYGTLNDLAAPLKRLEDARAGVGAEPAAEADIAQLLLDVQGADNVAAKYAVSVIVERVIAGEDQVEVLPRF
jgi:hypothetical protein